MTTLGCYRPKPPIIKTEGFAPSPLAFAIPSVVALDAMSALIALYRAVESIRY